ncbi:MAG TPA: nucleotidyltransferase domain-containing protein [Phycisphaerales bacterium]|nr:nucleotidyltransferase domain-containing protein [Phycisphaerales bacterium]
MISEKDKTTIIDTASRYKASLVLLFGSSADPKQQAQDIDLGVEGINPKDFFRFYGDLLFSLSRPVDVIDLSSKSKFTEIVRQEGIPLYG